MMLQAQRRWLVYKCTTGPACAQLFFTGRSLKRHQTLHHRHTPEWRNTFCCSLCDEEFEVLSALQAHAVHQHYEAGELGSDLEPGLEPCDTGSQPQAGACVQTRRTSKSVVSPSNDGKLAECNLKSAHRKTAKSTVKSVVHSLAESEWRSAKSMQQSTTKCGLSIAKSAHCVTRCASSTTNAALSSTQSAQHNESSIELGAVSSVTQSVVTITGSKTPLVPTEYTPNTSQLKTAWKPLTDGSASGSLTVKSPTLITVKTGEMIQTKGDCSAESAAPVQQQHSRGTTVDARLQSLGNVTRRTTKDVTHRPTETEKLKAKAPVSQKKKYKTGRIRAFKGERVVSSSIAVSSVKQLESCDGRGLLICQVCGQVFVSAARIREHLTEHPKCSRCLEHFSHEIDVAEHLCILKENSPQAGDISDDSMMHIDEEVPAVEPHSQDKALSGHSASPIHSLGAFSSSGGVSLSHHSISGSEASRVPRALAVHAEASSVLPAVGQGEDLSTSAATSDGSAPSCEAKTCPACSATFPSSVALVRHTLSHRPMQFFQCTACENIFTSRGSFTDHLSQCPSQDGCYSCSACSKPFSTLKGLRAHERRYHFQTPGAAGGNAFTCPECEHVFDTQTAYVNHLITHAVQQNHSDPKSLQCQVCSSSFYTRQALQKHMNSHKTDSPSIPVACPLCSETFANRRALVAHQKKHLYCPFCNRNFISRAELDAHNRETHQNERPWTCSLCNASYKFRFDLTRHQLKHEGKKFYACSTCGRDFYASTDLRQHEASVHSVIPRTKPFMCGQCGKRFFTRGHLNTHRRSHSSLQPFQCPHCPVRCKTTKNLEIHIRRHTGELPIKCKVRFCDLSDSEGVDSVHGI